MVVYTNFFGIAIIVVYTNLLSIATGNSTSVTTCTLPSDNDDISDWLVKTTVFVGGTASDTNDSIPVFS
jgi:hypothetical protein